MSITDMMIHAANFKRPVADYDDMGGVIYNLVQYSSMYPCRISPGVPSEVTSGPTQYAEATTMIYLLPDLGVERDDEAHVGADVYVVLGVHATSIEHHQALICKVQTDGV